MSLTTIFLAHAEADHDFAGRLKCFLEFGCDVTCDTDGGLIHGGDDLIAKAEEGLAAHVLALLLSEASCPARWPRERWEPVLFDQTRRANVELVTILLGACPFPELLRRRNFFDATANRLPAMRRLKRWFWQTEREPGSPPSSVSSSDLEDLYSGLADKASTLEVSGATASRFAEEADREFEAVLWVPAHRRSLAQIAGKLGSQLGLTLEGTVEQNCRNIRDLLSSRRCLLVLDAAAPEFVAALAPEGRTSTLVTLDPVSVAEPPPESFAYARTLISSRRYAEAYELLYRLLRAGIESEACARELTWICEHWDRPDEADSLRPHYGARISEQLVLF